MNRRTSKQSALLQLPSANPIEHIQCKLGPRLKRCEQPKILYSSIQICQTGRQRMQDFTLNDINSVPDIMHNNEISFAHGRMPRRQECSSKQPGQDAMASSASHGCRHVRTTRSGSRELNILLKNSNVPKFQQGRFVIGVRRMQSSSIKFNIHDTRR